MNVLIVIALALVPAAFGMVSQGPCPTNMPAYANFNPETMVGKQYIAYSSSYYSQYHGPCYYKESFLQDNKTITFTEYWQNAQSQQYYNVSGYAVPSQDHTGYYMLNYNYPHYYPTNFYHNIYYVILNQTPDYYLAWSCQAYENAHIEHAFIVSTHKNLPADTMQQCMSFLNNVKAHTEEFVATSYPDYCPY